MQLSIEEDKSLFGLDVDLDVHLLKLQAANVFSQIRKDIDRNRNTLKTLSVHSFGKRSSKNTFEDNVQRVVKGGLEARAILPLVNPTSTDADNSLQLFMLACFTLTKTSHGNLQKNGLIDIFAGLLLRTVDGCVIFPSLKERMITIIRQVCDENRTHTSLMLLEMVDAQVKQGQLDRSDKQPKAREAQGIEQSVLGPEEPSPTEMATRIPPDLTPRSRLTIIRLHSQVDFLGSDLPILRSDDFPTRDDLGIFPPFECY